LYCIIDSGWVRVVDKDLNYDSSCTADRDSRYTTCSIGDIKQAYHLFRKGCPMQKKRGLDVEKWLRWLMGEAQFGQQYGCAAKTVNSLIQMGFQVGDHLDDHLNYG